MTTYEEKLGELLSRKMEIEQTQKILEAQSKQLDNELERLRNSPGAPKKEDAVFNPIQGYAKRD